MLAAQCQRLRYLERRVRSMTVDLERFTGRLRALRDRRGLTQEGLARRAGISRGYLARLETCRQDPRLTVVLKLAAALKVRPRELLE